MNLAAWTAATIGVADMEEALALWVRDFGFELAGQKEGADVDLAGLWSISADDICRQALLRSPNAEHGLLHLVEFLNPEPPVRAGAEVYDSLPKNLDVYVRDMPARLKNLRERKRHFHNDDYSEVTAPNGTAFREMHMPVHDNINVVLLEVLRDNPANSDFAGIGALVTIVEDAAKERAFYRDIVGLDKLTDNILGGPEIEKMIGLPSGAALDVSIWGRPGHPLGQIEVIEYRGVKGTNRYARARPKALGVLHVGFVTASLRPLRQHLERVGVAVTEYGTVDTLYGRGAALAFHAPSGFRIEVHERAQS